MQIENAESSLPCIERQPFSRMTPLQAIIMHAGDASLRYSPKSCFLINDVVIID